jgi:uncharacterized RDD family membrane protein YckC
VGRPELDATLTAGAGASPPATGELAAGLQLDHFRIEKKLGAGGMGEVYLATDLALDRPVAIKVLPPDSASGTARDRLVREARAQARVHHPNVGHIYYIGEDAGRLYFAMEYLAGGTLGDKLASGPVAVDEALDTIRAAALGLREAQRSGFLHRDVKPSNLMLDAHGVIKVTDFGLAAGGAPAQVADGPVAQTTMAGTPLYMAPEQARGEAIDLRCDIYALGATLYHLVSGQPPFQAKSVEELLTMHRSARRPLVPRKGRARTTSVAIDALVAKMMAPDPKDRFASYDELLRAIELTSVRHTRPGGFWARGIASFIDMMIVLFAFALSTSVAGVDDKNVAMGSIGVPMIALLQTLCIRLWGTTPGKALFELEVVSVETGRKPRLSAALLRALALYGAPVFASWLSDYFMWSGEDQIVQLVGHILVAAAYVAVGLVLVHAALRVPGKRTPWDRISGTMVRYRTGRAPAA